MMIATVMSLLRSLAASPLPARPGFDAGDTGYKAWMSERDPLDERAEREADAAGAEAGSIGGRADENEDPAARPVEEAGGGEAEGFEQAEEDLREQAEHGEAASDPAGDAFAPEVESDRETAEYGEPDQPTQDERAEES
jgi:hypothetical protein